MYNEYGQIEYSARLLETIKTFLLKLRQLQSVNDDMEVINAISERTLLEKSNLQKKLLMILLLGQFLKKD